MFGMNTPAYFAIDDLTLAAVPEPWGGCLAWCGAAVMLRQARRTAKRRQDPRRA
jgi:hypothetical protein